MHFIYVFGLAINILLNSQMLFLNMFKMFSVTQVFTTTTTTTVHHFNLSIHVSFCCEGNLCAEMILRMCNKKELFLRDESTTSWHQQVEQSVLSC